MRDDMWVSKGLEFPVVALPGVGHMPAKGEDEQETARVFYVAATRATQRLVIGVGWDGKFGERPGASQRQNDRNETTHGTFADSPHAKLPSLIARVWRVPSSETACSTMHNVVRYVSVLN